MQLPVAFCSVCHLRLNFCSQKNESEIVLKIDQRYSPLKDSTVFIKHAKILTLKTGHPPLRALISFLIHISHDFLPLRGFFLKPRCAGLCARRRGAAAAAERPEDFRGKTLNQHYFPHMEDILRLWSIQVSECFIWKGQRRSFMPLRTQSAASTCIWQCLFSGDIKVHDEKEYN